MRSLRCGAASARAGDHEEHPRLWVRQVGDVRSRRGPHQRYSDSRHENVSVRHIGSEDESRRRPVREEFGDSGAADEVHRMRREVAELHVLHGGLRTPADGFGASRAVHGRYPIPVAPR
jgi:hypothetical protein